MEGQVLTTSKATKLSQVDRATQWPALAATGPTHFFLSQVKGETGDLHLALKCALDQGCSTYDCSQPQAEGEAAKQGMLFYGGS